MMQIDLPPAVDGLPRHRARLEAACVALSDPHRSDPGRDLVWLEDRVWTWAWYAQSKILRGELYEALSSLSWMREWVIFRLLAMRGSVRYRGARFAEELLAPYEAR